MMSLRKHRIGDARDAAIFIFILGSVLRTLSNKGSSSALASTWSNIYLHIGINGVWRSGGAIEVGVYLV